MGVGIAEEGDEETARGGVGLAEGPTGVDISVQGGAGGKEKRPDEYQS